MKFSVYTKYGCPYCTKILEVLNYLSSTKGFPIVEYVLNTDFTKEQFYDKFGESSTFPQVLLNEQTHLGGCSDTVKYLQEYKII